MHVIGRAACALLHLELHHGRVQSSRTSTLSLALRVSVHLKGVGRPPRLKLKKLGGGAAARETWTTDLRRAGARASLTVAMTYARHHTPHTNTVDDVTMPADDCENVDFFKPKSGWLHEARKI